MMTFQIDTLKDQLQTIVEQHEADPSNRYLDSNWMAVIYKGNDSAVKVQCKKDYYGWMFFKTSTDSAGTVLADKISDAIADYPELSIVERQL